MADLGVSCIVKRTSLSLSDLELETPDYCEVVTHGPGVLNWRRTWVTSPFAHGAYLTAAAKEMVTMPLVLRLKATNSSDLGARIDEVYEAFSQRFFELRMNLDSSSLHRWSCNCADITPGEGGTFDSAKMRIYMQELTLAIPRHPVPLQGLY